MDRKLIQLLSKYGKAENPPGQIIDLSTVITAILIGNRGYAPVAHSYSTHTLPELQTHSTHTPTHSSLQYNIWFIQLLGIVKSFTGKHSVGRITSVFAHHFSPYYQFFFSTGEFKASVLMFSSIQSLAFTLDIIFILVNHLSITLRSISSVVSNRIMCMMGESQGTNILFIYSVLH